jgi:murein DD-endopeptidase MepM/ murein hydrolase activator NlpD
MSNYKYIRLLLLLSWIVLTLGGNAILSLREAFTICLANRDAAISWDYSFAQPTAAKTIQAALAIERVPIFWYPVNYTFGQAVSYSLESSAHRGADQYAIDFLVPQPLILAEKASIPKRIGIYPTLPGRVVYADCRDVDYGCVVAVQHWDDTKWDKKYYSIYAHLAPNSITVSVGDFVNTSSQIGWMGKTGKDGNNIVHLHFAVRSSDYAYDGRIALYGQYDKNIITPAFNAKPILWRFTADRD